MDRYLVILIDSLKKKNSILDEIDSICEKQEQLVASDDVSYDEFNRLMVRKGELIGDMNRLDDGFAALYARISPELKKSPVDYREQILKLQNGIKEVSRRITLIQAREMRIQSRIDRMAEIARGSKERHVARSDAARKYYTTMNKTAVTPSIFVDSRRQGGKHDS